MGYVFQFFNLLPTLTAWQNVALPLRVDRRPRQEVRARSAQALDVVGLAQRALHHTDELSGGEMQRVGIARVLAMDVAVILADEPTGNLDSAAGAQVLTVLRQAADERKRAIILVTHDSGAAAYSDRLVLVRDGRIVSDKHRS